MSTQKLHNSILITIIAIVLVCQLILPEVGFAATRNIFQRKTVNPQVKRDIHPETKKSIVSATPSKPTSYNKKTQLGSGRIQAKELSDVYNLVISKEHGTIIEAWAPKEKTAKKTVVHIQDAHCNYSGQKNLAHILDGLIKQHGLKLILVEGGSDNASLSFLRNYGSKETRQKIAEEYLKEGKISGEEYLDIISEYPLMLWGIEDEELYKKNQDAFFRIEGIRESCLNYLKPIKAATDKLKPKIYPEKLLELEKKKQDFKDETLSILDYYTYLTKSAKKLNENDYPNLTSFINASQLEKQINFEAVEKQRTKLLDTLAKTLPKKEISALLTKSMEFKQNKVTPYQYYNYLLDATKKAKIAQDLTQLSLYVKYLKQFDSIKHSNLFKEAEALEEEVINSLLKDKTQRKLYLISKHLVLLDEFLNIHMTPEEYDYFNKNKRDFRTQSWIGFLEKLLRRQNIQVSLPKQTSPIDENLNSLEDFYQIAKRRDQAFVKNTINKMNQENQKLAVLIAGGFHTPPLKQMFKEKNISYVVISPKITDAVDPELYRKILKYKSVSLEEYLENPEEYQLRIPAAKDGENARADEDGRPVITNLMDAFKAAAARFNEAQEDFDYELRDVFIREFDKRLGDSALLEDPSSVALSLATLHKSSYDPGSTEELLLANLVGSNIGDIATLLTLKGLSESFRKESPGTIPRLIAEKFKVKERDVIAARTTAREVLSEGEYPEDLHPRILFEAGVAYFQKWIDESREDGDATEELARFTEKIPSTKEVDEIIVAFAKVERFEESEEPLPEGPSWRKVFFMGPKMTIAQTARNFSIAVHGLPRFKTGGDSYPGKKELRQSANALIKAVEDWEPTQEGKAGQRDKAFAVVEERIRTSKGQLQALKTIATSLEDAKRNCELIAKMDEASIGLHLRAANSELKDQLMATMAALRTIEPRIDLTRLGTQEDWQDADRMKLVASQLLAVMSGKGQSPLPPARFTEGTIEVSTWFTEAMSAFPATEAIELGEVVRIAKALVSPKNPKPVETERLTANVLFNLAARYDIPTPEVVDIFIAALRSERRKVYLTAASVFSSWLGNQYWMMERTVVEEGGQENVISGNQLNEAHEALLGAIKRESSRRYGKDEELKALLGAFPEGVATLAEAEFATRFTEDEELSSREIQALVRRFREVDFEAETQLMAMNEKAMPYWRSLLEDEAFRAERPFLYRRVVANLGFIKHEDAVRCLIGLLSDKEPDVVTLAASNIHLIGKISIPQIEVFLRTHPNADFSLKRDLIVILTSEAMVPESILALSSLMSDERVDGNVRIWSFLGLSRLKEDAVIELPPKTLQAMQRLSTSGEVEFLLVGLDVVRGINGEAESRFTESNATSPDIAALIRELKGDGANQALARLKEAGRIAVGPLLDFVRTDEPLEVRELAVFALEDRNMAPDSVAGLAEVLDDNHLDITTRRLAASGLAALGEKNLLTGKEGRAAIRVLKGALRDEDDILRGYCRKALGRVGADEERAIVLAEGLMRKDGKGTLEVEIAKLGPRVILPILRYIEEEGIPLESPNGRILQNILLKAACNCRESIPRDISTELNLYLGSENMRNLLGKIVGDLLPALIRTLEEGDKQDVAAARVLLKRISNPEPEDNFTTSANSIILLTELLDHKLPKTRQRARRFITVLEKRLAGSLIEVFDDEADAGNIGFRLEVIKALGKIGGFEALDKLMEIHDTYPPEPFGRVAFEATQSPARFTEAPPPGRVIELIGEVDDRGQALDEVAERTAVMMLDKESDPDALSPSTMAEYVLTGKMVELEEAGTLDSYPLKDTHRDPLVINTIVERAQAKLSELRKKREAAVAKTEVVQTEEPEEKRFIDITSRIVATIDHALPENTDLQEAADIRIHLQNIMGFLEVRGVGEEEAERLERVAGLNRLYNRCVMQSRVLPPRRTIRNLHEISEGVAIQILLDAARARDIWYSRGVDHSMLEEGGVDIRRIAAALSALERNTGIYRRQCIEYHRAPARFSEKEQQILTMSPRERGEVILERRSEFGDVVHTLMRNIMQDEELQKLIEPKNRVATEDGVMLDTIERVQVGRFSMMHLHKDRDEAIAPSVPEEVPENVMEEVDEDKVFDFNKRLEEGHPQRLIELHWKDGLSCGIFLNPTPTAPMAVVIVPDTEEIHPQQLTEYAVRVSQRVASLARYGYRPKDTTFRIGMNGYGAQGMNRLHIHGFWHWDREGFPIEAFHRESVCKVDKVGVYRVFNNFPARAVMFNANVENLTTEQAFAKIAAGYTNFINRENVPFSMIGSYNCMYIMPREPQRLSPEGTVVWYSDTAGEVMVPTGTFAEIQALLKMGKDAEAIRRVRSIPQSATVTLERFGELLSRWQHEVLQERSAPTRFSESLIPQSIRVALDQNETYTDEVKQLFTGSGLTEELLFDVIEYESRAKAAVLVNFVEDSKAISQLLKDLRWLFRSNSYKGVKKIFTQAYGWSQEKFNRYLIDSFGFQQRAGIKEDKGIKNYVLGLLSDESKRKYTTEFVKKTYEDMDTDIVVIGGGHGAGHIARVLIEMGHKVAVAVNAGDWGGGSWKAKVAFFKAWLLKILMPGDRQNVLGIGLAQTRLRPEDPKVPPDIRFLLNSRFPKGEVTTNLEDLFIDTMAKRVKEGNIKFSGKQVLQFMSFAIGMAKEIDRVLEEDEELRTELVPAIAGNSLQNFLDIGVNLYTGSYSRDSQAVDEDRFLLASYLLERAVGAKNGRVIPGYFEEEDIVMMQTVHGDTATEVTGGVNTVLANAAEGKEPYVEWLEHPESAKVKEYKLTPCPEANPALERAIDDSKMVIIAPGNPYESIFTTLHAKGVPEALQRARATGKPVVWVLNPVSLLFDSTYSVADYVEAFKQVIKNTGREEDFVLGEYISHVVVNDSTHFEAQQIIEEAQERFQSIRERSAADDTGDYASVRHREPLGIVGKETRIGDLQDLLLKKGEGCDSVVFKNFLEPESNEVEIRGVKIKEVTYGEKLAIYLENQYRLSQVARFTETQTQASLELDFTDFERYLSTNLPLDADQYAGMHTQAAKNAQGTTANFVSVLTNEEQAFVFDDTITLKTKSLNINQEKVHPGVTTLQTVTSLLEVYSQTPAYTTRPLCIFLLIEPKDEIRYKRELQQLANDYKATLPNLYFVLGKKLNNDDQRPLKISYSQAINEFIEILKDTQILPGIADIISVIDARFDYPDKLWEKIQDALKLYIQQLKQQQETRIGV